MLAGTNRTLYKVLLLFTGGLLLNPVNAQEATQLTIQQEIDLPFEWMRDLTSDKVQQWLVHQEDIQTETFKKSDFQKLDYVLTYGKNKTVLQQTKRYNFTVSSTINQPPKLKFYEAGPDPKFWTLLDCADFMVNENDYPNIEDFWVAANDLHLVAAISHSGQDWHEFLVYDLTTRTLLEKLNGILRPTIIFGEDGFYYERFDAPKELKSKRTNQRIAFHQINTEQTADKNVFVNADPSSIRSFRFTLSKDSKAIWLFHPVKIAGTWKRLFLSWI